MSTDTPRAMHHTRIHGQGVVQLAMYVARICAARLRPVSAGEIKELLCCSDATARRYLQAYQRVYPDHVDAQASGALAQASSAAQALTDNDPAIEAARAAAERADAYDNVDPDYPE